MTYHYKDDSDDRPLADGEIGRCKMMMRDSMTPAQRAGAEGSRSSWQDTADRYFSRRVEVTDASGNTLGLNRPGFRVAARDQREGPDARYDGRADSNILDARTAAYLDYERDLQNAWKTR
jgi:hypothetical protein